MIAPILIPAIAPADNIGFVEVFGLAVAKIFVVIDELGSAVEIDAGS